MALAYIRGWGVWRISREPFVDRIVPQRCTHATFDTPGRNSRACGSATRRFWTRFAAVEIPTDKRSERLFAIARTAIEACRLQKRPYPSALELHADAATRQVEPQPLRCSCQLDEYSVFISEHDSIATAGDRKPGGGSDVVAVDVFEVAQMVHEAVRRSVSDSHVHDR